MRSQKLSYSTPVRVRSSLGTVAATNSSTNGFGGAPNSTAQPALSTAYYAAVGGSADAELPNEPLQHQLSWRKKVYEFFSAPVTRFYLHVVSVKRPSEFGT